MNSSYYAKITDINELRCFCSERVRFLDPEEDLELIKAYFELFGICNETDTYFGINLKDVKKEYAVDGSGIGRLCAWVENRRIPSLAGVEFCSKEAWEIRAVSTHPDYAGRGFSKAVCSFAAKYVLLCGRAAICETHLSNHAMQAVINRIGMKQYRPQFD